MKIRVMSERPWKIVLCALMLLLGAVFAVSLANWQQVLKPGVAGMTDFVTGPSKGRIARVESVEAGSPLAALGVKAGDRIAYDTLTDGWRVAIAAGEPIGMTIGEGSSARHVTIKATASPHIDPSTATLYVLVMLNSLATLVMAGLIGLRRAGSPSARMLALILLMEAAFGVQFMPGGVLMTVGVVVLSPLTVTISYCALFVLSCRFPNDEASHVPRWVRLAWTPALVYFVATPLLVMANRIGWVDLPRALFAIQPVMITLTVMLAGVNLWCAYRRASGAARQRVQWVGMVIGVRFLFYVLNLIPGVPFANTVAFNETVIVLGTLANIALAYGILRHRLFDVGFAVNRALVYAIVSMVLLVSFGLMEWLAHHFVSPEEAEKNALLDAGIALGLYLVFHRLRHFVEHFVERLFFHQWHANEERLRRFVKQAAHVTQADALVEAYLGALQRFSGEAGCALYRLGAGGYELVRAEGMAVPPQAGIDEPLAVALRTDLAPAVPADCHSSLPGALVLPMSFRGELQGFVLLGHKSSQAAYRPDEIHVLEYSAQQVGLDLQALRTEQLQAELAALRLELDSYARAFELNGRSAAAA